MKHVTAPFSKSLGTTTSNFNPQQSWMGKITLMLLFLLISQVGIVAQSCPAPTTETASATLPSNCNTIQPDDITGQSGDVFELTINPANAYTFTLCYTTVIPGNFQFPQAEIYDELALTSNSSLQPDATSIFDPETNCSSVTYTPPVDCTESNMQIYLATYSHSCDSDWRPINIEVTCEGCDIVCGDPTFAAANNTGCSSFAFEFAGPSVAGSCDGNPISYSASADIGNYVVVVSGGSASSASATGTLAEGDLIGIEAGAPVGSHTITFTVEDCAGIPVSCEKLIVIEPIMACDDVVNVTLSQFCEMQITPGMLLEAECADESQYTVNILGQTDDIIDAPGMYEVQIVYEPDTPNSASGTYCWGFINAEDKSGPTCTLAIDELNVSCGEDYNAGEPVFEDCSGVASSNMITLEYGNCGDLSFPYVANPNLTIPGPDTSSSSYIELDTAGFVIDNVIVNIWTATDDNGISSSSCQQFIYVWRPSTVNPPIGSITVECGTAIDQTSLAALDPQYVPFYDNPKYDADTDLANDLEFTRVDNDGDLEFLPITDVDHSVCKFTVDASDNLLQELCGDTEKYIREFTVLDWCTGEIVVDEEKQVIKIEDTTAPTFTDCPGANDAGGSFANPQTLYTSSSAPGECGFEGLLTPPSATDECSSPVSYSANIFTSGGTGTGYVLVSQVQDLSTSVSLDARDYRVDYFATDACGNTSLACSVYYNVLDDDSPVAICIQQTTVSLTNVQNGTAEICADNVDSGSYDNCNIVSTMIKRMGSDDDTFAACLPVDCNDAGQDIMVVFRVVDAAGNSNICMVSVEVQDKVGPTIVCPADITVTCLESTSVDVTGDVIMNASESTGINGYAFDNCNINAVDHSDISNSVDCGAGVIEREFIAYTNTGIATCTQTITVEPDYNYFVSFPADVTIEDCANTANADMVGEPIISGVVCGEIGIAVSDQEFVISSGACLRIVRTYIVKNTCLDGTPPNATEGGIAVEGDPYKFQDDGDGYFRYTQNIDIVDNTKPVFNDCSDKFFDTFNDNCTGNVSVDISATDNCNDDLNYFWKVDFYSDGSDNDASGTNSSIIGVYPVGNHTVYAQVSDGCGNTQVCNFTIRVSDVKNPTIACVELNSVIMNGDARSVTIWATDFVNDGSTIDNCTPASSLVITAALGNTAGVENSATNVVVTCDDMLRDANGNALPTTFPVRVFVTDAAGNSDFCETSITVIDTENDCGVTATSSSAKISGRIFNESDEDVEDVMVQVESDNMSMNPFITDADGQFEFDELTMHGDYSVQPTKDINPANGVSTFDLVLLTRHILGFEQLDSPYKIIAADVNGDKVLDINDLIEVRQLILYAIEGFSSERSWSFVDAGYQFSNALNPLNESYPQVIDFNDLSADAAADFVGIKLGDLDGDSYANRLLDVTPRSFYPTANVILEDAKIAKGETVSIPFSTEDMENMSAMQFTIEFDQNAVDFAGVSEGALNVSESNFGFSMIEEGVITFSWNTFSGKVVDIKGQDLFSLDFVAKSSSRIADAVNVSSKYTPAIAFNDGGQYNLIYNEVSENGTSVSGEGFELFQNAPNPFKSNTVIGFNLPEAASATLRIMDVSGKELQVITGNYTRGYNKINLDLNSLDASGVLYYQLETTTHAATMKMIVIE